MSSTLKVDKKRMIYVYNRIITFDDISFGTGIHCMMTSKYKLLQEFIKNINIKNVVNFLDVFCYMICLRKKMI